VASGVDPEFKLQYWKKKKKKLIKWILVTGDGHNWKLDFSEYIFVLWI
jgi:hypothetical protein